MSRTIFVNLPVADVDKSAAFYGAVGATRDARFSQPGVAAAMVWSDTITTMLLSHEHFARFSPKPIADAHATCQVLLALSEDSRAAVDDRVARAVAAGGKGDPCPTQDHGFMYGRSYEDLDGHIIEVAWMDAAAMAQAMGPAGGGATG